MTFPEGIQTNTYSSKREHQPKVKEAIPLKSSPISQLIDFFFIGTLAGRWATQT